MGSADYGDHWRNLRRISVLEILSTSRLTSLFSIRRDEVNILTRRLYSVSSHGYAKVELRSMFFDLTSNVIMKMVAGKRYYGEDVKDTVEARMFREILKEFIEYISMIQVGDMIPILQWVDFTQDFKKLYRLNNRMDMFLQGLINEHRHDRERNTMINTFLTLQEQQPEYYTDEIIKGHILVMMIGGTETVATAMEWARACPGDGLGNRMMTLTLGSLIQFFEWERVGDDKIDMTEKTGISMCKVDPLELLCKARPSLNVLLS
ncbi:hypothetical protein OIU78_010769 [Salix suchowensis]|nr:hypothetical protein OIU78_010769 [Salix suchowensis]